MSMTAVVALMLGLALGVLAGWWVAGRRGGGATAAPGETGAHRLPNPALDWLRRAHGAVGVWIAELDLDDGAPLAERIVDADRLGIAQIAAVDRRLERARDLEESGSELLESGVLCFRASAGTAVGLLLPAGSAVGQVALADADLQRLLDAIRNTPRAIAAAQAQARDASFESVGSLGLRLAYQLERVLTGQPLDADVEVVVAAREAAAIRIVGVSGHADRRLLDGVLRAESLLAQVAQGNRNEVETTDDPFGGLVTDRRQRDGRSLLLPIHAAGNTFGAVALFRGGDTALGGAARAEIEEALANVAPRLAAALEAEQRAQESTVDPLTGLMNRRGLAERLARYDLTQGALIYLDLDKFTKVNDTLGHSAGDAALVHLGGILREQVRAHDVAARLGEDRFAVWLPQADAALGARVAERIRIRIESRPWTSQGQQWPLTASFGVAAAGAGQDSGTGIDTGVSTSGPGAEVSLDEVVRRAQAAVAAAKRQGRNRIEIAGEKGYI